MYYPTVHSITQAAKILRPIIKRTPLQHNPQLSTRYKGQIFLKREDMTPVRSYKLRGAYNKMSLINNGSIVSCSAGNHAQGVAFSCSNLKIKGTIYMPTNTPQQKIDKVAYFGSTYVNIVLKGSNFDECSEFAKEHVLQSKEHFIHPFDDEKIIEGQGTVGLEILEELPDPDYVILPVGGGGLASGVSAYIKAYSPKTKFIGVQPATAPSMADAINHGWPSTLEKISTFVDGASVKRVGDLNFPICQKNLNDVILIDEGHICSKILEFYNKHGIIIEPAGVLSLCALDHLTIKNKSAVCIISGGNSDVFRMPEILDRSLVYEGLKHYFKIQFSQRPGALKEFVMNVLGPDDDIIYFRYTKIINKEIGPVIVGIQLKKKFDINIILDNMRRYNIVYEKVKDNTYI